MFLFFMLTADAMVIDKRRADTLLSFLPAIHKLESAGVSTNDTYTYINDSATRTFLVRSLSFINDTMFSPFPKSMSETVVDILGVLDSTADTIPYTDEPFTYGKLLSVLTGSFDAILKELETVIKRGNWVDIK